MDFPSRVVLCRQELKVLCPKRSKSAVVGSILVFVLDAIFIGPLAMQARRIALTQERQMVLEFLLRFFVMEKTAFLLAIAALALFVILIVFSFAFVNVEILLSDANTTVLGICHAFFILLVSLSEFLLPMLLLPLLDHAADDDGMALDVGPHDFEKHGGCVSLAVVHELLIQHLPRWNDDFKFLDEAQLITTQRGSCRTLTLDGDGLVSIDVSSVEAEEFDVILVGRQGQGKFFKQVAREVDVAP